MATWRGFGAYAVLGLVGSSALVVAAPSRSARAATILFEDFNDGELATNPAWAVVANDSYAIVGGQLHSDGLQTQDSRSQNGFQVFPGFEAPDYLELSLDGLLKSVGNPQAGRGVSLRVVGVADGGTVGVYDLNIQNGFTNGFPTNKHSFSISYGANNSLNDIFATAFAPAFDTLYSIKAVRHGGEWSLFVDGALVGGGADPLGLTDFNQIESNLTGSIVVDNLFVATAPVPEPGTAALVTLSGLVLGRATRRRRTRP